jgi:hypothetical protein
MAIRIFRSGQCAAAAVALAALRGWKFAAGRGHEARSIQ